MAISSTPKNVKKGKNHSSEDEFVADESSSDEEEYINATSTEESEYEDEEEYSQPTSRPFVPFSVPANMQVPRGPGSQGGTFVFRPTTGNYVMPRMANSPMRPMGYPMQPPPDVFTPAPNVPMPEKAIEVMPGPIKIAAETKSKSFIV